VETLALTEAQRDLLIAWSRAAAPREACGLVLGSGVGATARVEHVTCARNVSCTVDAFEVDVGDQLAAERLAASLHLRVLGAWHSHVCGAAVPSRRDRASPPAYPLALIVDCERCVVAAFDRSTAPAWREIHIALERGALTTNAGDSASSEPPALLLPPAAVSSDRSRTAPHP
jgi:proteasome lid subunit RPN8/RPN11